MPKWYLKNENYILDKTTSELLNKIGDSALQTSDVPVAAIILYDGKIIGKGYNTAVRNKKVGEHAEINALSDALCHIGSDSFNRLDRNKLILLTTWEPCLMCEGAIINAYIKHVAIVKAKSLKSLFESAKMKFLYYWNRQVSESDTLQMNLFKKHPAYEKNKSKL